MIEPPGIDLELAHWSENHPLVAGVDEAGRGALAGPIVAACVIFPPFCDLRALLPGVRDSKTMPAAERSYWALRISEVAIDHGIGIVSAEEIDAIGIQPANKKAMTLAMAHCQTRANAYLLDYIHWKPLPPGCQRYKEGETVSISIAAASVLAKTTRDQIMMEMHPHYPQYRLGQNMGYGTKFHRDAIAQYGYCPLHRRTFNLK